MSHRQHDNLYKEFFSNPDVFLQLIQFSIKEKWVKNIDASSIQAMNKSFVLPELGKRDADLVYYVKTKDGKNDLDLYLLLELQSGVDYFMPYRLLIYMVCIWHEHLKSFSDEEIKRKDFRLPPIIPIVLSNSKDKWTAALNFKEILAAGELFGKYALDFQYFIVDINRCNREILEEMNNIIGNIFILEQDKKTPGQVMETVTKMIPGLENLSKEHFKIFMEWFRDAIVKNLPYDLQEKIIVGIKDVLAEKMGVEVMISNVSRVFEESLLASKLEGIHEGRLEGIQEGRLEGMRDGELKGKFEGKLETAENLLNKGMSEEFISDVVGLSIEEIQNLKSKVS